ncbi:MAG: ATP-binding protein [Agathobacter sp.]
MKLQQLYSYVRQAVDDYHMIGSGDRIAIGVSGGKDSLVLLSALAGLRRFYPKKFELMAVTVDLGFEGFDVTPVQNLCEQLQVPYHVVRTDIGKIVFDIKKEKSPCALCAKMRKGALYQYLMKQGVYKVAYAHHMDDVIHTMLLSLIYEGRFSSFEPVTHLDGTDISVIRPLIYVSEAEVIGFKNKYQLQPVKNPCPADGTTRRSYVKDLLQQINRDNPGVKKRLFHAVVNSNLEGWQKDDKIEGIL